MKEETKTLLILSIAFVILIICMFGSIAYESYLNDQTARIAIEKGYIQKVEGMRMIWVKE